MTTALLIKLVLPLSLLALVGIFCAVFSAHPPPHFNARQQQMIDSLKTANVSRKDLK